MVATVWRPQLDAYVREALAANTDLRAPPMPTFGAPARPCWSTARAVPCKGTWMHRARSSMPVATPGVGRAAVVRAGPPPLLSAGSRRWHPPRHRSRQRGHGGDCCGTRPGPRGRRCGRHPCLSPGVHKQSHARCNPAGAGDTARHAGGNPTPCCRRARNGLRCQPCRCRRQSQRGGDTAPAGGTAGLTVRTGRTDGQSPGRLSREAEGCPQPLSCSKHCRSVTAGSCSSGALTYAQPNAAWPPRLQ